MPQEEKVESNPEIERLFYDLRFGFLGFDKFWKKLQSLGYQGSRDKIKKWYDQQEINQMNFKQHVTKKNLFRIVAPQLSFQVDLMFVPRSLKGKQEERNKERNAYVFFLAIDVLTRKAFIYEIPNKRQELVMDAYQQFLNDVFNETTAYNGTENEYSRHKPLSITADDGFSFNQFKDYNKENKINIDTQTAKDDHISKGNRLGVIDRLTRTLKNILMRVVYSYRYYSVPELMRLIVQNYNNTPHQSLDNHTPNEVFADKNMRHELYVAGIEHNREVATQDKFSIGDQVRVLEESTAFEKEHPQWSKELYEIVDVIGNKYRVRNMTDSTIPHRAFKFRDLRRVDVVAHHAQDNARDEIRREQREIARETKLEHEEIEEENIIPIIPQDVEKPRRGTRERRAPERLRY